MVSLNFYTTSNKSKCSISESHLQGLNIWWNQNRLGRFCKKSCCPKYLIYTGEIVWEVDLFFHVQNIWLMFFFSSQKSLLISSALSHLLCSISSVKPNFHIVGYALFVIQLRLVVFCKSGCLFSCAVIFWECLGILRCGNIHVKIVNPH